MSRIGKPGTTPPSPRPPYDLSWFYKTLTAGNMPAVSFLKAFEYQDGHPGYSDPLDEQAFLV
jgi:phospholipase C